MDSTHLRYIQQQWSCRSDRESHLLWQKDLQENAEEIFNLERKSEKQNDTIGRQKVEIKKLKDEIKKVRKHVKVKVPRKNSGEFPKVASKVIQDITNNNNAEKVPTSENVEKNSPNTALESEPPEIEPAVKVSNRFQVLVDINDEPRLESASSDQKILTPGFIGSSCSPANQPFGVKDLWSHCYHMHIRH